MVTWSMEKESWSFWRMAVRTDSHSSMCMSGMRAWPGFKYQSYESLRKAFERRYRSFSSCRRVLGNGLYRVLPAQHYDPKDEVWEFIPGSTVRCETRHNNSGDYL